MRRTLLWLGVSAAAAVLAQSPEPRVLNSAAEIRALNAEQAGSGLPAELTGVVLNCDQKGQSHLFVHDGTAGLFIKLATRLGENLDPGDRVRISGVTRGGKFAPMMEGRTVVRVGTGTFPVARDVSYARLLTGAEDGQWIRMRGIVRSVKIARRADLKWLALELDVGGGRLYGRVLRTTEVPAEPLVDAEISMTGVCNPIFNEKRQLVRFDLSVPSMEWVHVDVPAPADPFAPPSRPAASLVRFDPEASAVHRVKVSGVVTHRQPGGRLYVRDATRGFWVQAGHPPRLNPGDQVDVLGFPSIAALSSGLADAVVRVTGQAAQPAPLAPGAAEAERGLHDSELVRLEGTVMRHFRNDRDEVLVLQEGSSVFRAVLAGEGPAPERLDATVGSRVQVTGICLVEPRDLDGGKAFHVLLRAPEDLRIVAGAPWWTRERILKMLGVTALALGLAIAWAAALRRRVLLQTRIIKATVEREAVHEERTRIAREFHDTLEQALVGIGMQLNVAKALLGRSQEVREPLAILDIARGMVRHSQDEVKRSIWNLRTELLEKRGLPAAAAHLADQMKHGAPVELVVEVSGEPQKLPGRVESHLLRIIQEAANNALKHARCRHIRIGLAYQPAAVSVTVEDDGDGFDCAAAARQEGRFGLLGMRERAEKIGGALSIDSKPGRGTRIRLHLAALEQQPALARSSP